MVPPSTVPTSSQINFIRAMIQGDNRTAIKNPYTHTHIHIIHTYTHMYHT